MSREINQYAVYRLKYGPKETRTLRHHTYDYLLQYDLKVNSDYYDQAYLSEFDPVLEPAQLRKRIEQDLPAGVTGKSLETSDVLAITRAGITRAYYVDPDKLVLLTGFFRVPEQPGFLTSKTADYTIEGRPGRWIAVEESWIDGQNYFLMQSQRFGAKAGYAVLDNRGRQVAQDTMEGFSDDVIRQIREHIQAQKKENTGAAQDDIGNGSKADQVVHKSPAGNVSEGIPAPEGIPKKTDGAEPKTDGEVRKPDEEERNEDKAGISSRSLEKLPAVDEKTLFIEEKGLEDSTQVAAHAKSGRKKRKRINGKLPLKGRESVLKRLRKYQEKLSAKQSSTP